MTEVGRDYWSREHPHPLAPNGDDVETYRELIGTAKSVLLLGNTPALMPLCTAAMDTEPFVDDPRVITQDWTTNSLRYDVIFGDGVLNFTADLAQNLVAMAGQTSSRFIARSFTQRLPIMRVAGNFPAASDFATPPTLVLERGQYSFFVWDFTGAS
jgi:hypothetical protein